MNPYTGKHRRPQAPAQDAPVSTNSIVTFWGSVWILGPHGGVVALLGPEPPRQ